MPPEDVTGSWWINAGAAAVTTVLAGGKLMGSGLSIGPFPLRDLLSPIVVAFWADATFWIPLLLLLFAWKHLIRRRMFRSVLAQWSVVFPLGMYCAATLELEARVWARLPASPRPRRVLGGAADLVRDRGERRGRCPSGLAGAAPSALTAPGCRDPGRVVASRVPADGS